MYFAATPQTARIFQPAHPLSYSGSGFGAIPDNESTWRLSNGVVVTPESGGIIATTYHAPTTAPPVYGRLPVAPVGSQGKFDFPWTIQSPAWTGNAFWWNGTPILNIGYPLYINDCWEYLRFALVDGDFASVAKWLSWAMQSWGWTAATLQSFNFAQWRFVPKGYGIAGAPAWCTQNYPSRRIPIVAAITPAPTPVAPSGGVRQSGSLRGLGAVTTWAPPYANTQITLLPWSKADFAAFSAQLERFATTSVGSQCLQSLNANWSQLYQNAIATGGGGPYFPVISLAKCPVLTPLWQGLLGMIAVIAIPYAATVIAGAAAAAGAASAASSAAGSAAVTAGATDTAATVAASTAAEAAGGVAASSAATDFAALGVTEEITVTGTVAAAGGGIGTAALVGGSVAAAGSAAALAESAGSAAPSSSASADFQNADQGSLNTTTTSSGQSVGSTMAAHASSAGLSASGLVTDLSLAATAAGAISKLIAAGKAISNTLANPQSVGVPVGVGLQSQDGIGANGITIGGVTFSWLMIGLVVGGAFFIIEET